MFWLQMLGNIYRDMCGIPAEGKDAILKLKLDGFTLFAETVKRKLKINISLNDLLMEIPLFMK